MTILGNTETDEFSDTPLSRRAFPRRAADKCVGVVNGQSVPVIDWSPGGAKVLADTRPYAVGEAVDVTLKFQFADQMINVNHRAQVVRKSAETFSLQFAPLTAEIRKTFQHVIDNFNTEEFVASQA